MSSKQQPPKTATAQDKSTGGMRLAGAGETGREMLVVNVNPTDKVAGLFL